MSEPESKPFTSGEAGPSSPRIVKEESKPPLDALFRADSPPVRPPKKEPSRSPSPAPEDVKPDVEDRKAPNGRRKKGANGAAAQPFRPVLIDHLPVAWDAAHETFESLEKCVYERKDLGLTKEQDEMMVCDCVYDKDDPDAEPCGPHSDCINRAIFIECLHGECRAKSQCRNQRFAKRQYAPIEVVLTEMKGFGLRAAQDIPSGSLIYEYIGEVVKENTFRKRMQQYADEGIKHFYFMMLQKEEYIDATKKGGIGRFANHSCNPNCEVQKWVVGRRLRMGIFSKRDICRGEEITFNYNVDRYGHDAQICYCGEPNCVGTIGGKTQTDIGGMNDLFLDALGITDEVEAYELKGSKKKKSRQLDEDFIPILHPITQHEVQKVAAAMRQSMENVKMMSRLLERIKMTDDPVIQRQLMRMHGFSLMSMVLSELASERSIVLLALESMVKWPLQIRNKVEDSNIETPVRALQDSDDEAISSVAKQLLTYWSTLEHSYKIPRVSKIASLDADDEAATTTIAEADSISASRRPDTWENTRQIQFEVAPVVARPLPFSRPKPPPPPTPKATPSQSAVANRSKLDAIIALAQQTVAAAAAQPSPSVVQSPAESKAESSRSASQRAEDEEEARRKRQKRSHEKNGQMDEGKREKRLKLLVGEWVVGCMNKYKSQMDHDTFKKYAKECTLILVEKEKKSSSYATSSYSSLHEDKKVKMKAFVKEYIHKVLKHLKAKGKLRHSSSSHHLSSKSQSSTRRDRSESTSTPHTRMASGETASDPPLTTPTDDVNLDDQAADRLVAADMFSDDGMGGEVLVDDNDGDQEMDITKDSLSGATHVDLSTPMPAEKVGAFNLGMAPGIISLGLGDTPERTPTSGGPSPMDK